MRQSVSVVNRRSLALSDPESSMLLRANFGLCRLETFRLMAEGRDTGLQEEDRRSHTEATVVFGLYL